MLSHQKGEQRLDRRRDDRPTDPGGDGSAYEADEDVARLERERPPKKEIGRNRGGQGVDKPKAEAENLQRGHHPSPHCNYRLSRTLICV
jgi:hypothetical protein